MIRRVLAQVVKSYEWLRERSMFQKFVIVFAFWSTSLQAQTTFDPVGMTEHIAHGDFEQLCGDTIMWIIEKPGDRWISQYVDKSRARRKLNRVVREHDVTLVEWHGPDHFFVVGVGCQCGQCLKKLRFIVDPKTNLILSVEVLRCVELE
jgi:bacterioferritin-associated ferredoxin